MFGIPTAQTHHRWVVQSGHINGVHRLRLGSSSGGQAIIDWRKFCPHRRVGGILVDETEGPTESGRKLEAVVSQSFDQGQSAAQRSGERESGNAAWSDPQRIASTPRLRGFVQQGACGYFRDLSHYLESHGMGQNDPGISQLEFSCGPGARVIVICRVINSTFLFPVGSNKEIEISLVSRPWAAGEDGTNPQEAIFLCQEWRK